MRRRRSPGTPRRLRTRVRNAIAAGVAVALVLFGVPLAVVLDRLITSDAATSLQRDATRALAAVPDNVVVPGGSVRVPLGTSSRIGVYDARGERVGGTGPVQSRLAAATANGREQDGSDGADLAVALPVLSDTAVAGSVRAAIPRSVVRGRVVRAWVLLTGLGLLVVLVSWLLARRPAQRVAQPFEEITRAARELGAGRFDVELPSWGITEADTAGEALRDSAQRIDAMVGHERAFMRDASHQLRTPLAAFVMQLESEPPDVSGALRSAHHLERTVGDLLAVRTVRAGEICQAGAVASEAVFRRNRPAEPVVLRLDEVGPVAIGEPALRQALDVLIDNALRHGAPPVTVTVEAYGDTVAVEVADHGPGFAPQAEPGTGLQLASRLVDRAGGTLLVRSRGRHPRVALLLPPAPTS